MQTIWTRVARASAVCKCTNCTVKSSLTRHAGSATGRRPTKYVTSSTLLYSTIFALAATTDALAKEHRNRKWDVAIAAAKESIEQLDQHTAQLPGREITVEDQDWDVIDNPSGLDPIAAWPVNSGHEYSQKNFAPQSAHASSWFRRDHDERVWSHKKLQRTGLAVDKLIIQTLLRLEKLGQLALIPPHHLTASMTMLVAKSRTDLEDYLREVNRRTQAICALDSSEEEGAFAEHGSLFVSYSHDDRRQFVEVADLLDRRLTETLQDYQEGTIKKTSLIVSALNSLTAATAPPKLESWNRLIQGFSDAKVHRGITRSVIDNMRKCNTRVNEETLIAILEHYRKTRDYDGFCKWVELMQGEGPGLMLARPDILVTEASQGRLVRRGPDDQAKIVQKPVATPQVLGCLVQGVLSFDGFDAALDMCQTMGAEGWGLSINGLLPLIDDCARRRDGTSGHAVWQHMQDLLHKAASRGRPEAVHTRTYASLLNLYHTCGRQEDAVAILEQAKQAKVDMSRLSQMVEMLQSSARDTDPRSQPADETDAIAEPSTQEEAEEATPSTTPHQLSGSASNTWALRPARSRRTSYDAVPHITTDYDMAYNDVVGQPLQVAYA